MGLRVKTRKSSKTLALRQRWRAAGSGTISCSMGPPARVFPAQGARLLSNCTTTGAALSARYGSTGEVDRGEPDHFSRRALAELPV
jgi:hypothetical protein